ncbi:MAG TPA: polysaccharide biosynthesis/export family protein [Granulicella sp.]|jgi:polysaccharide export outer membrane protein|nr:polysaccharide biosynthesis/export family protein [Granulicella sp.]
MDPTTSPLLVKQPRPQAPTPPLARWAAALVLLLLSACPPARAQFSGPALTPPTTDRALPVPTPTSDLLHLDHGDIFLAPGDLVTVHIYGSTDYGPTVRVNLDGTMQLPLIGTVSVKGLTLDRAEDLIAERLKTSGMYLDPQVTLQVVESATQVITVTGEAHAIVPVTGVRHLLEIISAAGGLPLTASHTVTINRPGTAQPIIVQLGTDPMHSAEWNVPVYPGDTIVLSRVGVIYLLGEFKQPGAIPIQQNSPLTLLQATSLGGGTLYPGRYDDLRIIRTVDRRRTLLRVDVKKVMLGKAPDPVLQADDILYLPPSAIKSAIESGGVGVLLSAVSIMLIAIKY